MKEKQGYLKRKITFRFLFIILIIFLFFLVVYENFDRYVRIIPGNIYDEVTLEGVFLRNEALYTAQNGDSINFYVHEGEFVEKNDEIATIYNDNSNALDNLKKNIYEYQKENISKVCFDEYTNLEEEIRNNINRFQQFVLNEVELSDLAIMLQEVEHNIHLRNELLDVHCQADEQLLEYYRQEGILEKSELKSSSTIVAPENGYIIYSGDGFENYLDNISISKITFQDYTVLLSDIMENNSICSKITPYEIPFFKLISNDACYFMTQFTEDYLPLEGNTVDLAIASEPRVYVKAKIIKSQKIDAKKSFIIFEISEPTILMKKLRLKETIIKVGEYGLFLPKEYVNISSNTPFILVKEKKRDQVTKVDVNLLFEYDSGYLISAEENIKIENMFAEKMK